MKQDTKPDHKTTITRFRRHPAPIACPQLRTYYPHLLPLPIQSELNAVLKAPETFTLSFRIGLIPPQPAADVARSVVAYVAECRELLSSHVGVTSQSARASGAALVFGDHQTETSACGKQLSSEALILFSVTAEAAAVLRKDMPLLVPTNLASNGHLSDTLQMSVSDCDFQKIVKDIAQRADEIVFVGRFGVMTRQIWHQAFRCGSTSGSSMIIGADALIPCRELYDRWGGFDRDRFGGCMIVF